jgi:hypothetical protein
MRRSATLITKSPTTCCPCKYPITIIAIRITTRQNNLPFSSLGSLGIRLLALLLSIRIAWIIASDPCGRSWIRDEVCLYILPFALPPIGSGCFSLCFFPIRFLCRWTVSRNHNHNTTKQPTLLLAECSWYTPVSCIVEYSDNVDFSQWPLWRVLN